MTSHFDVLKFIANCKVPTIVLCGTGEEGGPAHSMQIYDAVPDSEKKFAWIKNATHFMSGQDKQQAETADQIVAWLRERKLL